MSLNQKNINHTKIFTGTGVSDGGIARSGLFNLSVSGTFDATIQVQRSFDQGLNFEPFGDDITAPAQMTGEAAAGIGEESVIYRGEVTIYTSGTINFRLHQ